MGLFAPMAGLFPPLGLPAPVLAPLANVGAALIAFDDARSASDGLGHRIAAAFVQAVANRLRISEACAWDALVTAPAHLVALLWAGSSWDALAVRLFGRAGVTIRPTLH